MRRATYTGRNCRGGCPTIAKSCVRISREWKWASSFFKVAASKAAQLPPRLR
jgi:hypothetical protein